MTSPNLRLRVAKGFDNMDDGDKYPPFPPHESTPQMLKTTDAKLVRLERRKWVPRPISVVMDEAITEEKIKDEQNQQDEQNQEEEEENAKGEKQSPLEHRLHQIRHLHQQPLMLVSWLLCFVHALNAYLSQSSNDGSMWLKQMHRLVMMIFAVEMAVNYISSGNCWVRRWRVEDMVKKLRL
ncbi:hypothetical protein M438DRAFT_356629 [Aureobasidium pullulans EXF-150]|uniref:Uncharacterized protein n=1 Tax=Aureobasidium pullulans EXF-150 TaxID=1043002 RepID=A0A074XCL9_AURPU|nr:uncharacterized protein M438DRAFT_356629 [Aureobasidium pullulans EXF-150]KEQ83255.1 hypothetical protein M438DRAFT_356629 [Aureobasidium pullulans EXF-150]